MKITTAIKKLQKLGLEVKQDGRSYSAISGKHILEFMTNTRDDEVVTIPRVLDSCYEGHVTGLPNEKTHFTLPVYPFGNPHYMPQLGSQIWSEMEKIREIKKDWKLFGRYDGKLVYGPIEKLLTNNDNIFYEVPTNIGEFDEIRKGLSVNVSFKNVFRNAMMRGGLLYLGYKDVDQKYATQPVYKIKRQDGWPNNVEDRTYIPWLRWDVQYNPEFGWLRCPTT